VHAHRPDHDDYGDPAARLVLTMFAAIDGSRWNDFPFIFGEDVAYYRPGYQPISGLERLLRFYRGERIIASGRHVLHRIIIGQAGHLASWGEFAGTTKAGEAVAETFSEIYAVADGRIRERRTFFYRPAV
jgi:ketosteroid isomerase-like protein